jgi:hypothetical protein
MPHNNSLGNSLPGVGKRDPEAVHLSSLTTSFILGLRG